MQIERQRRSPRRACVGRLEFDVVNVTLRPMTDVEFDAWLPSVRVGYAEDLTTNGGINPAAARVKAEADTAQLFPGGQPSPEQLVFVIEAGSERVGELWLAEREEQLRRVLWVYDLRVGERYRGRGFARAAMEFAEQEAGRRGLTHVALNVFGGNEAARGLYRSLGYREDAVSMSKRV
jgi:ribosomal protein S18 acetylase RimI-like enzyme